MRRRREERGGKGWRGEGESVEERGGEGKKRVRRIGEGRREERGERREERGERREERGEGRGGEKIKQNAITNIKTDKCSHRQIFIFSCKQTI